VDHPIKAAANDLLLQIWNWRESPGKQRFESAPGVRQWNFIDRAGFKSRRRQTAAFARNCFLRFRKQRGILVDVRAGTAEELSANLEAVTSRLGGLKAINRHSIFTPEKFLYGFFIAKISAKACFQPLVLCAQSAPTVIIEGRPPFRLRAVWADRCCRAARLFKNTGYNDGPFCLAMLLEGNLHSFSTQGLMIRKKLSRYAGLMD